MRALVVDDEPIARRRLIRMLEAIDGMEVAGEAADGLEAREAIAKLAPDVVFLDIRMPGLDGLTLAAEGRGQLPPIVFTTAYDEYAVKAFETEAADYLLKPIEPARLRQAVDRLRRRGADSLAPQVASLLRRMSSREPPPRITARSGSSVYVFDPRELSRLSAVNKYVAFEHRGRRYLSDDTLDQLEQRLGPCGFVRVHRGELVNLSHVVALHAEGSSATVELSDGTRVAVSRRRCGRVREALGIPD